jgi:translation initiation factor 4E
MALVGGQFQGAKGLCGVVLGIRFQEDVLSVWTKDALDVEGNVRIKERLLQVLQLPANTVMEYKPHETASVQAK